MKTINVYLTQNNNYAVAVRGIRGQQSSDRGIDYYDKDGNFIKSEDKHPNWSWLSNANPVMIIGNAPNGTEQRDIIKSAITLGIKGYTTAGRVIQGDTKAYLPPVNMIDNKGELI